MKVPSRNIKRTSKNEARAIELRKELANLQRDNENAKRTEVAQSKLYRVKLPKDIGAGFQTIPLKEDICVREMKKRVLDKLFSKGLVTSKWLFRGEIRLTDFSIADDNGKILNCDLMVSNESSLTLMKTTEEEGSDNIRKIIFNASDLGMGYNGSYVNCVYPGSQAAQHGVALGWRILEVNGKEQEEWNTENIIVAIQNGMMVDKYINLKFLAEEKTMEKLNSLKNDLSMLKKQLSQFSMNTPWLWKQSPSGLWLNEAKSRTSASARDSSQSNHGAIDKVLNMQDNTKTLPKRNAATGKMSRFRRASATKKINSKKIRGKNEISKNEFGGFKKASLSRN